MSVNQRLVDELAQLRAQRVRARWRELGEEMRGDALLRVDPERRAGEAAPGELALAARDLGAGRVEHDAEAEPEAHPLVLGLGDRGPGDRLELGAAGQV